MRKSDGKTYILLAPFHVIVYNRPQEFQNSSGLFSPVGRCPQTWGEEWDKEATLEHDGFRLQDRSIRSSTMYAFRKNDARPLGYGLLLVNAHVEQHWKYP